MDTFMYERQTAGSMEVGSYAHRPIFHSPDEIPSIAEARLSPTELPFTADDFDDQLEDALELMPEILGGAEIKYATNGLLSLTPDAMPLIGETVEVQEPVVGGCDLDQGRSRHRSGGGGVDDPRISRARSPRLRHRPLLPVRPHRAPHVRARCAEHFNKTYGIVHPREQWASERNKRMSPAHPRTEALGAFYFEAGGWERPHWYESNAPLVEEYGVEDRPHEWDRRWWSPIQNAEHLAMRDRVGMVDLAPFVIFDFTGPGVVDYIQHMVVNNADVKVGRSVYTPLLTESGGFKADLTILRLGDEHYRVITGAFDGPRDKHWFNRHLPEDGSVHMTDLTSAYTTIGVWGRGPATWSSRSPTTTSPTRPSPTARLRRSTSSRSMPDSSESPMSATSVGRSTSRPSRACRCGTGCGRQGRTSVSCRSEPASTGRPGASRRATG